MLETNDYLMVTLEARVVASVVPDGEWTTDAGHK